MDDCNKAIRLNPHDEAALQLQAKIQQEIHH
jgi:hypothetical protein